VSNRRVSGSAGAPPAVGCAPAPDLSKNPPAFGRMISIRPVRARGGAPEPSGVENAGLHGRAGDEVPGTGALTRRGWDGGVFLGDVCEVRGSDKTRAIAQLCQGEDECLAREGNRSEAVKQSPPVGAGLWGGGGALRRR
jgi:hypothetical protein